MIRAILFDKDGTLTDFRATWEPWMAGTVRELAVEAGVAPDAIAADFGFDLETNTILPEAPFVTAPGHVAAATVSRRIGWSASSLENWLSERAAGVEQVIVPGAVETLDRLAATGLPLGVLTNAGEAEAIRLLARMGVRDLMVRVIGFDSGFGAKPDHRGAADFADALGLARSDVLLVGDGMTDMMAARGAGIPAVGVLTGTLGRAALEPHALAVLRDVTALPPWLAEQGRI